MSHKPLPRQSFLTVMIHILPLPDSHANQSEYLCSYMLVACSCLTEGHWKQFDHDSKRFFFFSAKVWLDATSGHYNIKYKCMPFNRMAIYMLAIIIGLIIGRQVEP